MIPYLIALIALSLLILVFKIQQDAFQALTTVYSQTKKDLDRLNNCAIPVKEMKVESYAYKPLKIEMVINFQEVRAMRERGHDPEKIIQRDIDEKN